MTIVKSLQARVRAGEWSPGAMLPARTALAREYGVTPVTIHRAVHQLVAEGILRAEDKRGTFVAEATLHSACPTQHPCMIGILSAQARLRPTAGMPVQGESVIVNALERAVSGFGGSSCYRSLFDINVPSVTAGLEQLVTEKVDGIVIVNYHADPQVEKAVMALAPEIYPPLIYLSWANPPLTIPHVYFDNVNLGYQAACHLLSAGYWPSLYLSVCDLEWAHARYRGIEVAVTQSTINGAHVLQLSSPVNDLPPKAIDKQLLSLSFAQDEFHLAYDVLARLATLCTSTPPEMRPGIIVANDYLGYAVLESAAQLGLVPGNDFGLIGFDDAPPSRECGLTSVRPPLESLGTTAACMVFAQCAGEETPIQVRQDAEVVARATTHRRLYP